MCIFSSYLESTSKTQAIEAIEPSVVENKKWSVSCVA